MSLSTALSLGQTALELGLICSLTVLALFLSYSMLNVCDLSTDGCFTLGAAVGAVVAIAGHPFLSIPAAMLAGILSGFITAVLQTRMGIDSLLAGIIVNTALYSVNIGVMGGASLLNLNRTDTVYSLTKDLLKGTPLEGKQVLLISLIAVALVVVFLTLFLNTRLGLAIRATGNNPDMVRSSSINPIFTTTVGLCVANAFTGLACWPSPRNPQTSTLVPVWSPLLWLPCSSAEPSSVKAVSAAVPLALSSVPLSSVWFIPLPCGSICRHLCSSWYPLSLSFSPFPYRI